MTLKLRNNAVSRLASSLAVGDTALVVSDGTGAKFPAIVAGEWFPITVIRESGALEIMRCTARTLDTMTVVRAQEGTAALTFNAGDRVELRFTAGTFEVLVAEVEQSVSETVADANQQIAASAEDAQQQIAAAVSNAEQQIDSFIPPYAGAGKVLLTNATNDGAEWGDGVFPDAAQTLTNKTVSLGQNTISGAPASSFVVSDASGRVDGSAAQKAIPSGDVVGTTDQQTLTGKTISLDDNTISGAAASSFVVTDASGRVSGDAPQKAIPAGDVVGTTDAQSLSNKTISGPAARMSSFIDKTVTVAAATGTVALNLSQADVFVLTLSGNTTLAISNAPALSGETLSIVVRVTQPGTAYTLTWFGGISWLASGGAAPAAPAAGKTTEYVLSTSDGVNWIGRKGAAN